MPFLNIALKNLLYRRARTLLTILGVAVGVQAMVALISISWGFEASWEGGYAASGTDLVVGRAANRNAAPTPFDQNLKSELLKLPHVQQAAGMLSDLLSIEDAPSMFVTGWETDSFLWKHLKLISGRWPVNDEENAVLIGNMAADITGKKVGDSIQIELGEFKVVGIYESPAMIENGAIVLRLSQMQRVTEREGKVNYVNVKLQPDTSAKEVEQLRQLIKERLPGMIAYTTGDVAAHSDALKIAHAMSLETSIIALLVGAICVMNTALMSVFERTQEIGVLLAIGWRRSRIVKLILYESVMLSLLGSVLGIALGVVLVRLLQTLDALKGKFEAELSLNLFLLVMSVSIVLGILGALYPAYRASKLRPNEALRYE